MSQNISPNLPKSQSEAFDGMPTSPEIKPNWFQSLVSRRLQGFELGQLTIHHPNGNQQELGSELPYQGRPLAAAEIRLHQPDAFFKAILTQGNIGLGESYVRGEWDTPNIAAVISWFILNLSHSQGAGTSSSHVAGLNLLAWINRRRHLKRDNSKSGSKRNIEEHYDLGNEFYRLWLDPSMTYSSALFDHPDQELESAQTNKYEALCQSLRLKPGNRMLEIGCGWGGFALHAALHHGVQVTAVTISPAQHEWAIHAVCEAGLEDQIELRLQDYRDIERPESGGYDQIVSIEMLEAVGEKHLESFFATVNRVLAPDGLLALQIITVPDSSYAKLKSGVDFIQRHIFPGSLLLSLKRIHQALAETGDLFLLEQRDLGAHYAETLKRWHQGFNDQLDEVRIQGFNETFIRKWNYYLQYCIAGFATRNISVVQTVMSRPNNLRLNQMG